MTTNTNKIIMSIAVVLSCAIIGSIIFVTVFTSDMASISPDAHTEINPTQEIYHDKTAYDMLPTCDELGGYNLNIIYTDVDNNIAQQTYERDGILGKTGEHIHIEIYKSLNETQKHLMFNNFHDTNSHMESEHLDIGDRGYMKIFTYPSDIPRPCNVMESADGIFEINDVIVTIQIEDDFIYDDDIIKYAHIIAKKI